MAPAKTHRFKARKAQAGQRLDIVLAAQLPRYSRQFLAGQIKTGRVSIDGRTVRLPKTKVRVGQVIKAALESPHTSLVPQPLKLDIIHQDSDIAVVNKPPGLVMHPAGHHQRGTLANALKAQFPTFYLVHRLDKDTSGVVVVALTEKVKDFLSRLFEQRRVNKTYIALLTGKITPREAYIDLPIKRGRSAKFEVLPGGREATSFYRVKEYIGRRYSLVEVKAQSGRTHQIRVHFKAINHPVVGV